MSWTWGQARFFFTWVECSLVSIETRLNASVHAISCRTDSIQKLIKTVYHREAYERKNIWSVWIICFFKHVYIYNTFYLLFRVICLIYTCCYIFWTKIWRMVFVKIVLNCKLALTMLWNVNSGAYYIRYVKFKKAIKFVSRHKTSTMKLSILVKISIFAVQFCHALRTFQL